MSEGSRERRRTGGDEARRRRPAMRCGMRCGWPGVCARVASARPVSCRTAEGPQGGRPACRGPAPHASPSAEAMEPFVGSTTPHPAHCGRTCRRRRRNRRMGCGRRDRGRNVTTPPAGATGLDAASGGRRREPVRRGDGTTAPAGPAPRGSNPFCVCRDCSTTAWADISPATVWLAAACEDKPGRASGSGGSRR